MSERAKRKARAKFASLEKTRVVVTRTPRHFTATVVDPTGKVLASATTKKAGVIKKDLRAVVQLQEKLARLLVPKL